MPPVPEFVDDPPSESYPGLRYMAPAGRPVVISTRSIEAARMAGVPLRLDRTAALSFLAFGQYSIERSMLADVAVVAPRVPVRRGSDGVLRALEPVAPPALHLDVDAAARGLRAVLEEAVAASMAPARRVAVALSGGLDSGAVAASADAVLRRQGRPPDDLLLYHFLPSTGPNEVEHARAIARHLGRELVEIVWPEGDPFDGLEALARHADGPFDAVAGLIEPVIRGRLQREGIDLVLTGDGGDEAIGAYRQEFSDPKSAVPRPPRWSLARLVDVLGRPLYRRWAPWPVRHLRQRIPLWLSLRVRGVAPLADRPPARVGLVGAAADRDRALRCACQGAIVGWCRMGDRMSGIRSAFPFLDPAVEDFVVALPQEHFAAGRRQKGLLRLAYRDALPEVEVQRAKDGTTNKGIVQAYAKAYGTSWAARHLEGGPLERLDLLPRRHAPAAMAAAADHGGSPVGRAISLIWISCWAAENDL